LQKKTEKTLKDLKLSVKHLNSHGKLSEKVIDLIIAIVEKGISPSKVRKCLKELNEDECHPKLKDAITSLSMIARDHGPHEAKLSLPKSIVTICGSCSSISPPFFLFSIYNI
jgi:hypothetical protein